MKDEELIRELRLNHWEEAADRLEALRAERDAWQETAAQFSRNEDYYRGLIDSAAPNLGSPMYTQDDGGVVPEPLRACLPKAVAALKARVAELEQEIVAHDHTIAEIGERAATLRARLTEAEESADLHFCRAERAEAENARLREALQFAVNQMRTVRDGKTGGIPNDIIALLPEAIEMADIALAKLRGTK
jgi:hypothetical protein